MSITYITGDATQPVGTGPRLIVHIVNDVGKWGAGFVLAVSRRWTLPEQQYRAWSRGELAQPFTLGQVQFVQAEPALWIANLVGQHGVGPRYGPPIRYDAVRTGLQRVALFATTRGASVHMPRIGAGLAGGDWPTIATIIELELAGLDVTVYDVAM